MTAWIGTRRDLAKISGATAIAGAFCTIPTGARIFAQDATPETGADGAGTLVVGKPEEAVGLDPAMVTASASHELIFQVYEPLVRFDENGEPYGVLAESWEMPDDTTYVFTLREGVTFHNGQPLTAEDVKFTFERIKDPETSSPWTSQLDPVDSIEATDERTVTFNLRESFGPFLATMSLSYGSIVPNDPETDFQTTMIGTGPFMVKEYRQDVETVLEAFPDYRESGRPQVGEVRYRILPDESTRVAAVRTGEIHITPLVDPVSIDTMRQDSNVEVIEHDTTDYYLLGLNTAEPPFDDVRVRQALSMAIDRQAVIDGVFFGAGQVTGPIVPTLGDWASPIEDLPNYTVDHDAARALLEEAGASDLTFSITVGANRTEFVNIALVIQDQLADIGVTVELDQVEWGTFIERWISREFESFVSFNGSGNDPDRALYPALTTGGSVNAFQFSNEELDEILQRGRSAAAREDRQEAYREAEMLIAEQAPLIFISTKMGHFATASGVEGFAPTAAQTWLTIPDVTVPVE
jgi:peptide/nickel transport system substrate-binding protein